MVTSRVQKELNDFVESLNSNQFKMVENFFETMPKLSHTINGKSNTKVDSEIKIELQSFRISMAHGRSCVIL